MLNLFHGDTQTMETANHGLKKAIAELVILLVAYPSRYRGCRTLL